MNPTDTTDPTRRPVAEAASRAVDLLQEAEAVLGHMDTRLTLAEAKVAMVRHMIARRRERDATA